MCEASNFLYGLEGEVRERRKTFCELVRVSAAVAGIEFSYAAETAFVSPTLLQIGVAHRLMTLAWALSPLVGFFVTPLLGSLSDRCRLPWGRRRPFIALLAAGVLLGLILVPNGADIGYALGDPRPAPSPSPPGALNATPPLEVVTSSEWQATNASLGPGLSTTDSPAALANESSVVSRKPQSSHPWGVVFTILGTVLLDFDADACQSPARAYLLDVTVPEDHARGLSTFTIMAGLGGFMGYALGGINWDATFIGRVLGGHVRAVFTLITFIFVACVTYTVTSFREIPLDVLEADEARQQPPADPSASFPLDLSDITATSSLLASSKFSTSSGTSSSSSVLALPPAALFATLDARRFNQQGKPDSAEYTKISTEASVNGYGYGSVSPDYANQVDGPPDRAEYRPIAGTDSPLHGNGYVNFGYDESYHKPAPEVSPPLVTAHATPSLGQYLMSIVWMPGSLRVLCLTNLFCWMAHVCYSLYFTDFVGEAVFGGDPQAEDGTKARQLYEEGVRFGCWGMSMYSLSCACYSFIIERLINRFRARKVYVGGLLFYSAGMALMALTKGRVGVILFSWTAGVMYSTLFTMPYLLVAHYHASGTFSVSATGEALPGSHVRGLGTDVAIVSSMVFLAQFALSMCMGAIVSAAGTTTAVAAVASFLALCGAVCASQVMYLDL
ncbi:membrane-associated transporter protein-like [Schistocerca cancellata]|uniref:membrane-associated transporter protein-like n=1 Tax=Schistocerca cancellata TaxID=274614 RepID=UPI0021187D79|nr:membrane-associated transporter protein-like [Schistocerca cancellata]